MEPFRVAFVAGVTPDKWARIWAERAKGRLELTPISQDEQESVLRSGAADVCLSRLPIDRDGVHLIPLYREVPVVVVSKEHVLSLLDEVTSADLVDELELDRAGLTTKQAIETVAAGTGYIVVPMSVARLHHRKDVVARPLVDGEDSQIGLAWLIANEDPRIEDFIGIVRGRTERSSRAPAASEDHPARKRASSSSRRRGR